MVKFKGSCDSRDLEKDAQFYYEKLVQWLNDNASNDDECVEAIEVLDNLVELVGLDYEKKGYQNGYEEGSKLGYDKGWQEGQEQAQNP